MQSPILDSNPKRSKQAVQTLGLANAAFKQLKDCLNMKSLVFAIHLDVNVLT